MGKAKELYGIGGKEDVFIFNSYDEADLWMNTGNNRFLVEKRKIHKVKDIPPVYFTSWVGVDWQTKGIEFFLNGDEARTWWSKDMDQREIESYKYKVL